MGRIRSIKPQFFLDDNLATITRDARLFYIGLWCVADDEGVFEWRPGKLKAELFPYDHDLVQDDIDGWLKQLEKLGDITKFHQGSKSYGLINSFLEHQRINRKSGWRFAKAPDDVVQSVRGSDPEPISAKTAPEPEQQQEIKEEDIILSQVFTAYEKEIGMITASIADGIKEMLGNGISPEWLKDAFQQAAEYNHRSWAYARKIVENWQINGRNSKPQKTKQGPKKQSRKRANYDDLVQR